MIIALLFLIIAVALLFRVYLPWDIVMGDWVRFLGVDSYKIMWVVDKIVSGFPAFTVGTNLWEYTISGVSNVVSSGIPSVQVRDLSAAWLTPFFSCLTIVTTFFIGKMLFNKWAGLIAAGLLATFGGEYMSRTLIGVVDYHGFEVFLTTAMILFIVLAVKRNNLYMIAAGFLYGCYYITWGGALLFALIFNLWLVVEFARKHVNEEDSTNLMAMGATFYLAAMAVTLVTRSVQFTNYALIICLLSPAFLYLVSYAMKKIQVYYYPPTLVLLFAVSLGLSYIFMPGMWIHFGNYALYMFTWSGSTIGEEMPLFINQAGQFTTNVMWLNFGVSFILALIGALVLYNDRDKSILLAWFTVVMFATLALRRFTYYLAVPVSLIAGYLAYFIITVGVTKAHRVALAVLVVCVLFAPNIPNAIRSTEYRQTYYTDDWHEAIKYLRNNMPFKEYLNVMSWADYGYWIMRDGRADVVCTPAQGDDVIIAAKFFVETDPDKAYAILIQSDSPFIMVDRQMISNKFPSISELASSTIQYQSDGYYKTMAYRLYNNDLKGYTLWYEGDEVKILRHDQLFQDAEKAIFISRVGVGTVRVLATPFYPYINDN